MTPKSYAAKLAVGELCDFSLLSILEVQTIRKAYSKTKMNSSLVVGDQTIALGALVRLPLAQGSAERLRGGEREEPVGSLQACFCFRPMGQRTRAVDTLSQAP